MLDLGHDFGILRARIDGSESSLVQSFTKRPFLTFAIDERGVDHFRYTSKDDLPPKENKIAIEIEMVDHEMVDHVATINETVILEPKYLDMNIDRHIKRKLKLSKIGTCTKEQGFIKDLQISKIKPSPISMADGNICFAVKYEIHALKPKPGNTYLSKSISVFSHKEVCCVISEIYDSKDVSFQIFIINGSCKGSKYKFEECKCSILVDGQAHEMDLSIVVDTVEYNDNKFIVTGKHLHEKW